MAEETPSSEAIEYVSAGSDLETVYANVAGVKGGPFDAALDFGYVIAPNADGDMAPDWIVRVAMSWEHLSALHQLIGSQLEKVHPAVDNGPSEEQRGSK